MAEQEPPDHPAWLEKLVEDRTSVPRLIYWVIGFVVLAAAVIAAVTQRHGHGAAWWLLLVAGVLIVGLSAEHVRRHYAHKWAFEDLRQAQDAKHLAATEAQAALLATIDQEKVTDPHFDELKAMVTRVHDSVARDTRCAFADPKDRGALAGHFPELGVAMAEWDKAIGQMEDTSIRLEFRLVSEAGDRAMTNPTFNLTALVSAMVFLTKARADTGILNSTMSFGWEQFQDSSDSGPEPTLWWHGYTHAMVYLDLPAPQTISRGDAMVRVERLFFDMQSWPETLAYANRNENSGWEALKAPLLDQLDDLIKRDHYKKGNGCPRCN